MTASEVGQCICFGSDGRQAGEKREKEGQDETTHG
jgi:hypothetical protein